MQQFTGRSARRWEAVTTQSGNGLPGSLALPVLMTAVLVMVALWPALRYQLPPLADYPNHLARMAIIAAGGMDADLSRYYFIDWKVIPNLAMDFVVPWLAKLVGIYTAGQLFMLLGFGAIVSGMWALSRALFQRWSLVPVASLPFIYNYPLLVGTGNYLLGLGLALWALAAWVLLRETRAVPRIAVGAGFVTLLFFCHLFVVGVFGLGVLAFEMRRWVKMRGRAMLPRVLELASSGIAFLPVPLLMLASPTSGLAGSTYWELNGKLAGLMYAVVAYSTPVALAILAILAGAALWAWRRRYLEIDSLGLYLLAIGAVAYVAMPRMLFDTHMADQRLPLALLFIVLACVDVKLPGRRAVIAALALLAIPVVLRVVEVDRNWAAGSAELEDVRRATLQIERGARVVIVKADPAAEFDVENFALTHAGALATVERSALTTRLFTVAGKQVLRLQPAYQEHVDQLDGAAPLLQPFLAYAEKSNAPGEYIYWQHWPKRFDYVLLLHTRPEAANPDKVRLRLVQEGRRFRLYRIVKR